MQLRCKKAVEGKINFGLELDEYVPLNGATKAAMRAVVSMLKRIVGDDLHHSPGDDPKEIVGEAERPIFSMPMFALDQFIETPQGEDPPSLADPDFLKLGIRRSDDFAKFRQTMESVKFVPGSTYTLSFWSISQFLDCLRWQICGVIPGISIDGDKFCGRPPLHIVMYTLSPPPPGCEADERHLDSRKNYLLHLAFWSSERKPPSNRLKELFGSMETGASDASACVKAAKPVPPKVSSGVLNVATPCRARSFQKMSRKPPARSFSGCFQGLRQLSCSAGIDSFFNR
jgi:hypothetical protein